MIEYLTSLDFLILMVKIVVIFGGVMGAVAYLSLVERKLMARVQMRPGPTRVGPFGLLQPIADGLKFLFKEEVIPTNANVFLYIPAPIVSLVPALLSFSVIPFGPWLQVTDLSVGLLFIFADYIARRLRHRAWRLGVELEVSADGSDAVLAQMISYELSLTLSVVGVLMIANTLASRELVYVAAGHMAWLHSALEHLPAAGRIRRVPDQRNRRNESPAVRYGRIRTGTGWRLAHRIQLHEVRYVHARRVRQHGHGLGSGHHSVPRRLEWPDVRTRLASDGAADHLVRFEDFRVLSSVYLLLRSTIPRFRYDQLMKFGWKVLLPLALANILVTSFIVAIS